MREPHEPLIKTPTRLLVARKCTGRILLAVITLMVLFAFVAIVQEAQAEITEVRAAATRGWSNHRNRNVFYNGSRFFLLYHNNNEIYYKSSTDNITWSEEALLVSGASYTDFDIYLIDDTKFDLVYKNTFNSTYVRTYTISCGTLTTAGNSALVVSAWAHNEIFVGRSGADRIYVVGRFNGYIRIYSADQTGDAENVTSWNLEKELKNTGSTNMTMLPYQNEDKILMVYSKADGVYARVAWYGGRAGSEYGPHQAGGSPEVSSPVRISDTDFRVIIGPASGNNAYMEEWKFNGSAWSYVATVDSSENDKYNPSLFYDRLSGDMYVFCFDLSGTNIIRHYKPSGGSWGAGVDVDGSFTPNTYAYPITQMHEPSPASGRTVPRELVWAFKVPNSTNYDLIVGNLRVASPPAPSVAGYSCYRTIRVESDEISGTSALIDFPLLVKFENDSNLVTGDCAWVQNTDGWDIIFTDDSDTPTVQYDHEIEKFNGTTGTLFAWVRLPSLSATADTDLRMWYGKSAAADTSNPSGVWDCNYAGVWHLKESSGSGSYIKNSKQNDYHADPDWGSTFLADAKIAGGRVTDSKIYVDNCGDLFGGDTAFSLSFWAYPNYASDAAFEAAGEPWMFDATSIWGLRLKRWSGQPAGTGWVQADVKFTGDTTAYFNDWDNVLREQWNHFVLNYDGSALRWFINGNMVQESTYVDQALISNSQCSFAGNSSDYIDEFRYSTAGRSAEWIEAVYKNVTDSNFYSVTYESCGVPHENPGTFSCSRTIRVDHTKVSDLDGVSYYENFPMLIKFSGDNAMKLSPCGEIHQVDGSDIMFTDSNGYVLDHEIEEYDGSSGTLVAWVEIPELYTGAPTDITVHYGKESLQCATDNPTGVWDGGANNNYKGVWHLKEDPEAAAPEFKDSTAYGNHGSAETSMNSADQVSGQMGGAIDFDGSDDMIEVTSSSSLNPSSAVTVEAWIYWPNCPDADIPWVVKADDEVDTDAGVTSARYALWSEGNSSCTQFDFCINDTHNDGQYCVEGRADSTTTPAWYHLVGTFSGTELKIYRDGSLLDTKAYSGTITGGATESLTFARSCNGCSKDFYGTMDEVRISDIARTAGWIATEYANQSDPDSFYSTISDTCGSGGGGTYDYCKRITIPRGNVTAPTNPGYLADFPLLVKIANNNDLKDGVTNAEGWDIVFIDDTCGPLKHEIESYDSDTGTLVAWVKIPQLNGPDASSDTFIYMKYGDDTVVCTNEDPGGVWESYKGVWHLNESGNSTPDEYKDSTSNNNHGEGGGVSGGSVPARWDGKINYSQYFHESTDIITVGNRSSLDINGTAITLEAWVKYPSAPEYGGCSTHDCYYGILSKNGYSDGYRFMIGPDERLEFQLDGEAGYEVDSATTLSESTWHHVVNTYDGATMKAYIDGAKDINEDSKTNAIQSNTSSFVIGHGYETPGDWYSYPYHGNIDEVRVSDVARSDEWIATSYSNQNDPESFITLGSCLNPTLPVEDQWEEKF